MNDYDSFDESGFWSKIRRNLGRIDFIRDVLAAYHAMRDERTPRWAKVLIGAALAYLVTPLDAIPDFVPGGLLDDAGVLAGAIATASVFITEEHYTLADRWLGRGVEA